MRSRGASALTASGPLQLRVPLLQSPTVLGTLSSSSNPHHLSSRRHTQLLQPLSLYSLPSIVGSTFGCGHSQCCHYGCLVKTNSRSEGIWVLGWKSRRHWGRRPSIFFFFPSLFHPSRALCYGKKMLPADSLQPESKSAARVNNNNNHVMHFSTTPAYHHQHQQSETLSLHHHSAGIEFHWPRKSASMAPNISITWIWSILLILFAIHVPVANAVSQSLCSSFNTGADSDDGKLHLVIIKDQMLTLEFQ